MSFSGTLRCMAYVDLYQQFRYLWNVTLSFHSGFVRYGDVLPILVQRNGRVIIMLCLFFMQNGDW